MMRKLLHRAVWQKLPRGMRRAALFAATRIAAPHPDPHARPKGPVIVVGCLRSATGLGEAARLAYMALQATGFDVRGIDVSGTLMQPADRPDFTFRDGRDCRGSATLLVHVNAPLMPLCFLALGARFLAEKYVVGCWSWELPVIPRDWTIGESFVHEIWTPSRFTAEAVRARIPERPVRVAPHPVALRFFAKSAATMSGSRTAFTALTMFDMSSSFARKNPLGAVASFRRVFDTRSDARLIVKMSRADVFPAGREALRQATTGAPNIKIIEETLTPEALSQLFAETDCIISLHRAEGFGLTIAEAMLRSIPSVLTDWSGTTDFVSEETGAPVAYRLVPAHDPQGEYEHAELTWAEPDLDDAAEKVALLADPVLRSRRGEAARAFATAHFTAEKYAQAVRERLGTD